MPCGVNAVTTETGKKMEINTEVPKAILCCLLTPYHFTLKACFHKDFKVPMKHNRVHGIVTAKTLHNLKIMGG